MTQFMRNCAVLAAVACSPCPLAAADDVWLATHNLKPGDVLRDGDVQAAPLAQLAPDAMPTSRNPNGLEVKRMVYIGHPVGLHDVGTPLSVRANTAIEIHWQSDGLVLVMQGSALESGAVGDEIRVLNPATSRSFRATVIGDEAVEVRSTP